MGFGIWDLGFGIWDLVGWFIVVGIRWDYSMGLVGWGAAVKI